MERKGYIKNAVAKRTDTILTIEVHKQTNKSCKDDQVTKNKQPSNQGKEGNAKMSWYFLDKVCT